MNLLKLSLLSFTLAALMVGCSQDNNDEDPLVPEIESIIIEGTNAIHSIAISSDELQLNGRINYTDGTSSTTYNELDWESNDTSIITVHNGLLAAVSNQGIVNISASYRDKIFTTTNYNVKIISLSEINITSDSSLLKISEVTPDSYHADTNDSGPHQINVYGTFIDGNVTSSPITTNIVWDSNDSNVASITNTGLLSLVFDKNASAELNVSVYNDINATLELNVTKP